MKNLKIGAKIFLSFGIVILMMFFMTATVLVTSLTTMSNIGSAGANTDLQSLMSSLQTQFMNARIRAEMLTVRYDDTVYAEYEGYIQKTLALFDDVYACIDESVILEDFRPNVQALHDEIIAWERSVTAIRDVSMICLEAQEGTDKAEDGLAACIDYMMQYLQTDIITETHFNDVDRLPNIQRGINYIFTIEDIVRDIGDFCDNAHVLMQNFNHGETETITAAIQDVYARVEALPEINNRTSSTINELLKHIEKYDESFAVYVASGEQLSAAITNTKVLGEKAVEGMDDFSTAVNNAANNQMSGTISLANTALIVVAAVALAALLVAVIMAVLINAGISKPMIILGEVLSQIGDMGDLHLSPEQKARIKAISEGKDEMAQAMGSLSRMSSRLMLVGDELGRVAEGDLTAQLELLSEQDTMGRALEKMVISLNGMFHEINASTVQVSAGAGQIAASAQMLAQGSSEQATAVQQLSESISDIADKTKDNAAQATQAAGLSDTVRRSAERGETQMQDMMQAVKEINEASNSISKVMKVIDDIAFQTNILALNAAVEAARAGQHGKGFAVVAQEVRNLAAKSSAAAGDTGVLISNSIEKAQLGARIAEETAASLSEIVSGINKTSRIVSEIAASSEHQSQAIGHINHGIDQVTKVVRQNSTTSAESAATSGQLSNQSSLLSDLIGRFRLNDEYGDTNLSLTSSGAARYLNSAGSGDDDRRP